MYVHKLFRKKRCFPIDKWHFNSIVYTGMVCDVVTVFRWLYCSYALMVRTTSLILWCRDQRPSLTGRPSRVTLLPFPTQCTVQYVIQKPVTLRYFHFPCVKKLQLTVPGLG